MRRGEKEKRERRGCLHWCEGLWFGYVDGESMLVGCGKNDGRWRSPGEDPNPEVNALDE